MTWKCSVSLSFSLSQNYDDGCYACFSPSAYHHPHLHKLGHDSVQMENSGLDRKANLWQWKG